MPTLSSRPNAPTSSTPTQQDVIDAAQPSINILMWLTNKIKFSDDRPATIAAAVDVIEEALDCMAIYDYAVLPIPSAARFLAFDVAVKPLDVGAFVFFQVRFHVL